MAKRITLTDREIWHIVRALQDVQEKTTLDYQVILSGRQALQDIIDKLQPPPKQEKEITNE